MHEREVRNDLTTKATLETIPGIPPVVVGDNVGKILADALELNRMPIQDKDVIVIAQKIISKSEGRTVRISESIPTDEAIQLSQKTGQDPRLVQLILNESKSVRWSMEGTPESPGIIVVKHKLGFICSGAGIDTSNTGTTDRDIALLLPENPDDSAKRIASYFDEVGRVKVGVMIIDTLGDPYRIGSIGKAIGISNIPARLIEGDIEDLDGRHMPLSDVAFADSLAGFAMVLMGDSNTGSPAVLIRGVNYSLTPTANIAEVYR